MTILVGLSPQACDFILDRLGEHPSDFARKLHAELARARDVTPVAIPVSAPPANPARRVAAQMAAAGRKAVEK